MKEQHVILLTTFNTTFFPKLKYYVFVSIRKKNLVKTYAVLFDKFFDIISDIS